MTQEERIFAGKIFNPRDPALQAIKKRAHKLCYAYNRLDEDATGQRAEILSELLGSVGTRPYLLGPIWFNYGVHTTIGDNFFGNYNLVVSDDARVTIGDSCMFGPNCTIATPRHPLMAEERRYMVDESGELFGPCMADPVVIGNDVWLAANVTVCGGVTIGDGAVIGAGSVVTRDIPPNVVAAGVPCRVLRAITQADSVHRQSELF